MQHNANAPAWEYFAARHRYCSDQTSTNSNPVSYIVPNYYILSPTFWFKLETEFILL